MAITGIINYFDPEKNFVANLNWLDKKTKEESTGFLSSTRQFFVTRLDSALVATPIEFITIAENALLSVGRLFGAAAQLLVKGVSYIAPAGYLDSIHNSLPNTSEFIATLVKTIKYALGTFSTATVGTLSPTHNLKIHSYLGLFQDAVVNSKGAQEEGQEEGHDQPSTQPQQSSQPIDLQFTGSDADNDNNNNNVDRSVNVESKPAATTAATTTTTTAAAPAAAPSVDQTNLKVNDVKSSVISTNTTPTKTSPGDKKVYTQQEYQELLKSQRYSPQPYTGFYPAPGANPVVGAYNSLNAANFALSSQQPQQQQSFASYYGQPYVAPAARAVTPTKISPEKTEKK